MSNMEDYKRVLLGESYVPKKETLDESYDVEYNAILETIEDLEKAETELDEWIEDFEEGFLDKLKRKKEKRSAPSRIASPNEIRAKRAKHAEIRAARARQPKPTTTTDRLRGTHS